MPITKKSMCYHMAGKNVDLSVSASPRTKKADAAVSAFLVRRGRVYSLCSDSQRVLRQPFTAPLVMPLIICSWNRT